MTEERIARLNELARKQKAAGLTQEETAERQALREEYLAAIRGSLESHLENTYILEPDGTKRKLTKRDT